MNDYKKGNTRGAARRPMASRPAPARPQQPRGGDTDQQISSSSPPKVSPQIDAARKPVQMVERRERDPRELTLN